jgi:hypothetical protein
MCLSRVEPRPGRQPDGRFVVSQFLIVLAGDTGHRALPVGREAHHAGSLWRLLDRPPGDSGLAGVPEETAAGRDRGPARYDSPRRWVKHAGLAPQAMSAAATAAGPSARAAASRCCARRPGG